MAQASAATTNQELTSAHAHDVTSCDEEGDGCESMDICVVEEEQIGEGETDRSVKCKSS